MKIKRPITKASGCISLTSLQMKNCFLVTLNSTKDYISIEEKGENGGVFKESVKKCQTG